MNATNATKLAIMLSIRLMPAEAPLLAASKADESGLKIFIG